METLRANADGNLNGMGEIKSFHERKEYRMENPKQKPKERPKEGDGRKGQSKDDRTGRWGKHEPVRERPADREKAWRPWKKK